MEAVKELDPFISIIKLCQPTASQEAKFLTCPLDRESEKFFDSNLDQYSSSTDPTRSQPAGIVMVSPSGSSSSIHQQVEEDMVFHTPPEHHFHSHSSEDQNLDEVCAEGLRTCDGRDGYGRSKKVRVFEGGLDDEADSKKIRVQDEEFDGETIPVGKTEEIVIGIKCNQDSRNGDVIVVDSSDSGEEMDKLNARQKNSGLMKDGVPQVDPLVVPHDVGKKYKPAVDMLVSTGEMPCENSCSSGSLNSSKIEEEIVNLKSITSNGGADESEKFVNVTKDEKMSISGCRNGGLKTDGKPIQDIDEFRYDGGHDVQKRLKRRRVRAVDGSSRKRQLPVSLNGKEMNVGGGNVVEPVESKSGLSNLPVSLNGKEKNVGGGNVVGPMESKSGLLDLPVLLNRKEKNVGGGNVVEPVESKSGLLDLPVSLNGKEKNVGGGNVVEPVESKSGPLDLPVSLNGKEKNVGGGNVVEPVESKSGLLDFLNLLKVVVGDMNGACEEDVDFLETAKRRGLAFPRARWWPPESDDE